MATRISFSAFFVSFLLSVACAHDQEGVKFTYSSPNGPDKWGSLSQGYHACSEGKSQSPIDIKTREAVKNNGDAFSNRNYSPSNATLVSHCNAIGVKIVGSGGGLSIDGKQFTLKQFHWHTPSEHLIDGVQYDAELHIVHQSDDGQCYAVVGIIFKYGPPDPLISKLQQGLEELANGNCRPVLEGPHVTLDNLYDTVLEKTSQSYYRYLGSLTTPPCSENVVWTVLGEVSTISKEQVELLKSTLEVESKSNSRPAQALNGRQVSVYSKAN
ncbi:hypothetical protein K2173_012139 [Erythroxylum novogranatense]|uniref:Carbonic anhydrase n=1 Tax=Erythroxylum novogranatense TaxID=1862640 RepID=A0AAV8SR78_9ROSI|nr:hypothetical protein K2173_012139 [Erythroxylum novogranatense]